MTKRPWVIHPFLIAPFPVLLLYSRNFLVIDAIEAVIPTLIPLVVVVMAWGIFRLTRISGPVAGLILSTAFLLFFSFGHIVRLLGQLGIGGTRLNSEYLVLGGEVVLLAGLIGLIVKKPWLPLAVNGAANASSMALVGLSVLSVVPLIWDHPYDNGPKVEERLAPQLHPKSNQLPDVYLIILDAYGRSDVLKEVCGFDNSGFLGRLEQKGFVVARRSTSNYCQTALSLSSTLNLRYLDDIAGSKSEDRRPLKPLVAESAVFRAFRALGYRFVTFASGSDSTEHLDANLTVAPASNIGTFPAMVANQTPLWLLLGRRTSHQPHRMHRERILMTLDELPSSEHPADAPTLTFAHILSPHPPFVFGPNGEDVSEREGAYTLSDNEAWCRIEGHQGSEEYARRYRDQVTYLTTRVEQTVDRILATSKIPPIILIQGDHGPGSHFDASRSQPNDVVERMSILSACYLPEEARAGLYDSITPVNLFRVVFDQCFGTKLGMLPDRNYYSAYNSPYVFQDVSREVQR